jgi:hypothetical protein
MRTAGLALKAMPSAAAEIMSALLPSPTCYALAGQNFGGCGEAPERTLLAGAEGHRGMSARGLGRPSAGWARNWPWGMANTVRAAIAPMKTVIAAGRLAGRRGDDSSLPAGPAMWQSRFAESLTRPASYSVIAPASSSPGCRGGRPGDAGLR